MVLPGCALNYGTVYLAPIGIAKSRSPPSSRLLRRRSSNKIEFPITQTSWASCHNLTSSTPGIQRGYLCLASSPLERGQLGRVSHTIPRLPKLSPQAYLKDVPYSYRYPEKAGWWWRILSSITYLKPLHEAWAFAETTYHIHPFLEDFGFLTFPFWEFVGRLPTWFFTVYNFVAFFGIARRKEFPRLFRSHVMTGLLLDTLLQVVGVITCHFIPHSVYLGKAGMHFWSAFAFAVVLMVYECIICALSGKYADVPFVSDAAYLQVRE